MIGEITSSRTKCREYPQHKTIGLAIKCKKMGSIHNKERLERIDSPSRRSGHPESKDHPPQPQPPLDPESRNQRNQAIKAQPRRKNHRKSIVVCRRCLRNCAKTGENRMIPPYLPGSIWRICFSPARRGVLLLRRLRLVPPPLVQVQKREGLVSYDDDVTSEGKESVMGEE